MTRSLLKPLLILAIATVALGGVALVIRAAGGFASPASVNANNLRQTFANTGGLVAWYQLDGDVKDSTSSANNGTLSNTFKGAPVDGFVPGAFGKGLLLDGSSDYVSIPSTASNNFTATQDFTVSAWINLPAAQNYLTWGDNEIVEKWSGSGSYPYVFRYINTGDATNNKKLYAARYDGTNHPFLYSTTFVNDATWHHVAFTKSGSTLSIYIDGTLSNTATDTATGTTTNSSPVFIGKRGDASQPNYLTGTVDDVRIYNRALSAAELTQLYAGSPPTACDQTCKVYYKFNDKTGTSAADSSGAATTGTLTNFAFDSTDGWNSGIFSGALKFNAANNEYVSVPNPGLSSGSVDFWINPSSGSIQQVFSQLSGASSQAGKISINSGSLLIFDGSTDQVAAPAGAIPTGQWSHVVVTYSGGVATAYVNGRAASTVITGFAFGGGAAGIGSKFLGSVGANFGGLIDDFRIYSRTLTPEEISDQWRLGT